MQHQSLILTFLSIEMYKYVHEQYNVYAHFGLKKQWCVLGTQISLTF